MYHKWTVGTTHCYEEVGVGGGEWVSDEFGELENVDMCTKIRCEYKGV